MNEGGRQNARRRTRFPQAAELALRSWPHGRSHLRNLGDRGIAAVRSREYLEGDRNGVTGQLRQHDTVARHLRVFLQNRSAAHASLGTGRGDLRGIRRTPQRASARLRRSREGVRRFPGRREAGPDRRENQDPVRRENTPAGKRGARTPNDAGRPPTRGERSVLRVRPIPRS